ncbi:MAG: amidohydrolase [Chitinophagaceae bacterium]|nr:amidohydrolase [Chitinophagaceae bacterium]
MKRLLLFAALFILLSCNSKKADLIIRNAVIYTVDSNFTTAEAMVIKDGEIIAIGRNIDVSEYSADSIVDAKGAAIFPGFIDAHAHFVSYGQSLFAVNLFGCNNWQEALERVKKFAAEHPNEAWIRGRGWDQNKWPGKSFPNNDSLNALFPGKPVLLTRVDGHAAIVNNKALELAGVKPGQQLTGGEVETKNGKLTGILIDNAVDLVSAKIPASTSADYEKTLLAAQQNCVAQGLTTITDCGLMYNEVAQIDTLQQNNKLKLRLYVMLSDDTANYNRYLLKGPYKSDLLYVKGIKVYADGALGSRGACLLQPYADKQGWKGFLLSSPAHFDSIAKMLSETNWQMCTHAIGDSGNRIILNIYAKYLKGKNDKRWRIEHAQVVDPADFHLFGDYSIIPSVQPTHATSDMYWAGDRLGKERLRSAYAYKQLLQQNNWLPLGTDFPVEDISPFKTFLAAVFRKDDKGFPATGFQMENSLSREQTIRGMTIWAAKANCMEKEVGSLEKGKLADFIILSDDLMKVDINHILSTTVSATYINGKKVYGK